MAGTGKIAKRIWNFIESLGAGVIFTTRLLLSLAKRNTIDKNLARFKNKGLIAYLADGVYMLPDENAEPPSAWEIIQAKAKAFHKRVCISTHDTHVFDTDGCPSKFKSIHGTLRFRAVSPRKIHERTQIKSKHELVQRTNISDKNEQPTPAGNAPQISLNSLIRKLHDLLAAAETRLNPHQTRRQTLRHSISLQHF